MNDYIKIILPVVLTGMGALGWDMNHRISTLESSSTEGRGYIKVIERLQASDKDFKNRIRIVEDKIQVHLVGKHCEVK